MLTKMKKTTAAAILGSAVFFGLTGMAGAETIVSADQKLSMETPDVSWKEIPDWETGMTLTNGKDYVTVNRYDKADAIQHPEGALSEPTLSYKMFEEVVQTFYSTAKDVYVITGLAENISGIEEVRFVVNSIQLSDHAKKDTVTEKKEAGKEEKKTEKKEAARTGASSQIFYMNSNSVQVYEYTDGTWKDENGVEYWRTTEGQWANSEGSILYDYVPEFPSADPTGLSFYIYWGTGNAVLIHEYANGTYLDDDGISYVNNYDGTWTSSQGGTLYDDENGGMYQNEEYEACEDYEVYEDPEGYEEYSCEYYEDENEVF